MRTLAATLLFCLCASEKPAQQLPALSIKFYDPLNGTTIEPDNGWLLAQRDKSINAIVSLEVESVEAPYEFLVFRDSHGPDPLVIGSKRPQSFWLSVFRRDENGERIPMPILTHCSGGGKNLRVYSSTLSFRILYHEPERTQRVETLLDRMLAALPVRPDGDREMEMQREIFRRQAYAHAVDMPPGDYLLEATYAPIVEGMWKGKLQAIAKIRIGEENDPLTRNSDQTLDK